MSFCTPRLGRNGGREAGDTFAERHRNVTEAPVYPNFYISDGAGKSGLSPLVVG